MEDLYREARRILFESQGLLVRFERDSGDVEIWERLGSNLLVLKGTSVELRGRMLSSLEENVEKVWSARLRQLDEGIEDMDRARERASRTVLALRQEQRMREELLQRRSGTGQSGSGDVTVVQMEFTAEDERRSLTRSDKTMDSLFLSGRETLEALVNQGQRLKGARTMLLDIANYAGASKKLIRQIERRANSDTVVLMACMLVTILVVGIVYALRSWLSR
mmetsp:Transcript_13651/g.27966  ORF Transcript_13651/g.27966 Transcript_13651/m.27966 type:complete len:221 (-) Transcript_13651:2731-3393(-)